MTATERAAQNFAQALQQSVYPGRGLVIGRASNADAYLQIYWIMGRSTNSRNRKFVADDSTLRTEPVDLSKVQDPSLIIYDAMLELPGIYLVSNGDQTRTLYETLQQGGTFDDALGTREREPDAPNFTPRISGMVDLRSAQPVIALNILKANLIDPTFTDRFTYRPAFPAAGFGFGITTYSGDGNPLPAFSGDPMLLPCAGSPEAVLETYWNALDVNNRISLAVKFIPVQGGTSQILIRNRF